MATTRTYGIEIECEFPFNPWGGWDDPLPLMNFDRDFPGWDVRDDGSLNAEDGYTAEVVSPVLSGERGIFNVINVCKRLTEMGVTVNRSCGLHVHVGYNGYTDDLTETLDDAFELHEMAFFGMAGHGIRNRYGDRARWCKPKSKTDTDDRYRALNLTNWMEREECEDEDYHKPTFEVRAFGPTTNWKKAVAAILLSVGLVEGVRCGDLFDLDSGERRCANPVEAMARLTDILKANPKYLPIDPASTVAVEAWAQSEAQARNARSQMG